MARRPRAARDDPRARPPARGRGCGHHPTVCATGNTQHQETQNAIVGPNYRFIADLGDLRRSMSLLVPGQSGQPDSPHYDDQIAAWFAGGMHPMLFEREDVDREAAAALVVTPA